MAKLPPSVQYFLDRGIPGKYFFEDVKVGDECTSYSRTITEADIVNFAGLSGDFQPPHVDKEYAKTIFKERIAHGLCVLSIASGLVARILMAGPETRVAAIAFAGINNWKFRAPVVIGDTITVKRRIADKRESRSKPDRGIVMIDIKVINQKGETVQEGQFVIMVYKRPFER